MFFFISGVLLYFSMLRKPEHTQTQPFYGLGSLTYSPFPDISIDRYYYNRIDVTAIVADPDDFKKFNITVCSTVCPLATVNDHLPPVIGYRLNNTIYRNYYVNLRNWPSPDRTNDAQYFTLYMLEGSSLTFVITRLVPLTDVHVCITDSVDVCNKVYDDEIHSVKVLQEICQKVLTLNETNDHNQTFTVRSASYYCAIWILKDKKQLLNYTVNINRRSYNINMISPPSRAPQCQTHQKQTNTQSFDLRPHIAYKRFDPVCIAIRVIGKDLHNNVTLVSEVVNSKIDNITFLLGLLFAAISVFLFLVILVMVCVQLCHNYVMK